MEVGLVLDVRNPMHRTTKKPGPKARALLLSKPAIQPKMPADVTSLRTTST